MTLHFTITGNPRGKGRPRITTRGGFPRAYTDEKTRAYEEQIAWAAKEAGAQPSEMPCTVVVTAYMQIPVSWNKKRKQEALESRHVSTPDVDNIAKVTMDGLNGVAWRDDSFVYWLNIKKLYSDNLRMEVTISYDDVTS